MPGRTIKHTSPRTCARLPISLHQADVLGKPCVSELRSSIKGLGFRAPESMTHQVLLRKRCVGERQPGKP